MISRRRLPRSATGPATSPNDQVGHDPQREQRPGLRGRTGGLVHDERQDDARDRRPEHRDTLRRGPAHERRLGAQRSRRRAHPSTIMPDPARTVPLRPQVGQAQVGGRRPYDRVDADPACRSPMKSLAATAGAALDQFLGEPPVALHPVAHFGSLMQSVERRMYADRRARGVAFTTIGVGVGVTVGLALPRHDRVDGCDDRGDDDLRRGPAARRRGDPCSRGCSRTVTSMQHDGTSARSSAAPPTTSTSTRSVRAVIESVAENSVDAVTASLFWGSIGGAPAVLAHRAVNTLDAMVGHRGQRYERFGWASARLDDVVNFLPARLTVVAVAAVRPRRAGDIWRVVRRDARRHPSPNGGIIEATFAAALGVRLGGINRYGDAVEDRGTLGDGPAPAPSDIASAVRLRRHATAVCARAGRDRRHHGGGLRRCRRR